MLELHILFSQVCLYECHFVSDQTVTLFFSNGTSFSQFCQLDSEALYFLVGLFMLEGILVNLSIFGALRLR